MIGRTVMKDKTPVAPDFDRGARPNVTPVSYNQGGVPSLRGGVDWINSGPIALSELRGKIVLLDFWTFCCINCHHILPDLAKLEEKYKNELVVIGVHSGKFDAERDTANIRRKVAEYRIRHPVVNDAKMTIWNRFGVNSWPTIVLIDSKGDYHGSVAGEGHYDILDREIGQLVESARVRGDLDLTPLKFTPEMERSASGPLLYPGKVLADPAGKRLFIADTGHNRIVQTSLDGTEPLTIGTGDEGFADGASTRATFNRPQGMCLDGTTLYIADTENHAIRAVDLTDHSVTTVAGTGSQARNIPHPGSSGSARTTPLCSPWDLIQLANDKSIYIAMAGTHQVWKLDLGSETVSVFAGSGVENIRDGTSETANFAQPSGLATDGQHLYVADSEASGIRVITGISAHAPAVRTIVGQGLFEYGDKDGHGAAVRLQHCLGLAFAGTHLYVADSYNNKVKICEPRTRSVHTFVGSHKPGDNDNPAQFYEPGGLSATEDRLYVADTNNSKIRTVDLKTRAVKTLALEGLNPPRVAPSPPSFPNKKVIDVAMMSVAPGNSIALAVTIPLAHGLKLNEEVPLTYLVETPEKTGILGPEVLAEGQKIKPATTKFTITVPLATPAAAGEKINLRLSLQTFVCSETSSLCMIKSFIWNIPVTVDSAANEGPITLSTAAK
jgi:thiol-disulfide isomerase/thioredoxin